METSDIQCWEVCVGEETQREARGSGELFALYPPPPPSYTSSPHSGEYSQHRYTENTKKLCPKTFYE